MKKLKVILISLLIASSLYIATNPIMEVRYNSYDKTVLCYTEGEYYAPEGCSRSIHPTVLQTISVNAVLITSLGLMAMGIAYLWRKKPGRKKKRLN